MTPTRSETDAGRPAAQNAVDCYTLAAAWTDRDLAYLPLPNWVEVVLTDRIAPPELTRTAFAIPVTEDGSLVMVDNRRRGLEMAGGHVEDGEDLWTAACREALEETGCVVEDLVPIGFIRMISHGEAPEGWRYPHPTGYQQVFAGRVVSRIPFVETDECRPPRTVSADEAASVLKGSEWTLCREAILRVAGADPSQAARP